MAYDLLIIGGGPAGVAAGVYAARKKLAAVIVADSFGGQSVVSADIQNWIGVKSISGLEFSSALEGHLRAQEGIEIREGERVASLTELSSGNLSAELSSGATIETHSVLLATGSVRRKLGVPGERELDGKGVSYCSICDAPLFKGEPVVVVGGGNSALEAVVDLIPYASSIKLIHRGAELRGDKVTQERIFADPKVSVSYHTEVVGILGTEQVETVALRNSETGETSSLPARGIFVEIGLDPVSDLVRHLVKLDSRGAVIVDSKTQRSSHPRIWAAGDVTDGLYRQNNISMGDATKAVLNICEAR